MARGPEAVKEIPFHHRVQHRRKQLANKINSIDDLSTSSNLYNEPDQGALEPVQIQITLEDEPPPSVWPPPLASHRGPVVTKRKTKAKGRVIVSELTTYNEASSPGGLTSDSDDNVLHHVAVAQNRSHTSFLPNPSTKSFQSPQYGFRREKTVGYAKEHKYSHVRPRVISFRSKSKKTRYTPSPFSPERKPIQTKKLDLRFRELRNVLIPPEPCDEEEKEDVEYHETNRGNDREQPRHKLSLLESLVNESEGQDDQPHGSEFDEKH